MIPEPDAEAIQEDEPQKSKMGLIAAAIAALLLLGGGGYWWSQQQGGAEQAATQPAPPPPVIEPEPVPAGPTEEELNAKIQELIAQQADAMEDEIRKDYSNQLSQLQGQLDSAKKDAEARRQREADLEEQARLEEEARLAEEAAAAQKIEDERLATEAAAAAAAEEETRIAKLEEEAEAAAPPPPPPPPPRAPQVRRGDLVEMGPGVVAPKLVRRPNPRFPEQARRLARTDAKVLIKVLIDENGKVTKAELVGERQGYGFDTEALNSAKRSVYKAATKDGVPVKIWQTLAVEFRR